jgi:hypothetical protein
VATISWKCAVIRTVGKDLRECTKVLKRLIRSTRRRVKRQVFLLRQGVRGRLNRGITARSAIAPCGSLKRVHGSETSTCALDADLSPVTMRLLEVSTINFPGGGNCGYMNLRRAVPIQTRLSENVNPTSPAGSFLRYREDNSETVSAVRTWRLSRSRTSRLASHHAGRV